MIRRNGILCIALIISFVSTLAAQPLADRIPADAIVYVGWTGADSMGPGFEGSHLKAMLDAAEVQRIVKEVIPKLFERLAQQEPQAGEIANAASDVLRPMWRHPTALYIGPVDMANPDQPVPRAALICDAGEEAAGMRARLEELVQQAGGNVPFPMAVRTSGNVVALVVGKPPQLDAVFEGKAKAKALVAAKNFVAAMSMQKSPVIAAYIDAESLVRFIDEAVEKSGPPEAKKNWPAARDALGLRGFKRLSVVEGFDGKDWGTHAFIEAPAPRTGLLSALDGKPVGDDVFRIIPSTATVAGVARGDLAALFDGLRSAISKMDPDAGKQVDEGIKQVNEMLGLDVRQDVIGSLGDQWAYYIAPEVTGRGPMGVVVVNRLKDAAKAQAASDKLKELANNMIAQQADPNVKISFKQTKVGDVTVHYLAIPFVTPSWGIQNGNLYVGLYPQIVAEAAGHVSREGKSILDNPGFIALRKRLGGEGAISIQYYDLPRSAPTSYQVWLMLSSFAKVGDVFGVDTPAMMLPPLSKLMQHLSPAGAVSWVDEAGWHYRAVAPFPGSTVLASETAGLMDLQTTALFAGMALPSLARARESATRVQSMSNLRTMGQAMMLYANENKGKFPDELGSLLAYDLTPQVFVNPQTGTKPPAGLDADALKQWVNESSDYVYTGKGQTFRAGADTVLAHEKPGGQGEGLNILFADGHVEFQPMTQAMQTIEKAGQAEPALR